MLSPPRLAFSGGGVGRAPSSRAARPDPGGMNSMRGDVERWKEYKKKTSADGSKKRVEMSAWEVYTDGEYGQAFKFPWEAGATDKTVIGHAIPIAIIAGLYLLPLAYGVATGAF